MVLLCLLIDLLALLCADVTDHTLEFLRLFDLVRLRLPDRFALWWCRRLMITAGDQCKQNNQYWILPHINSLPVPTRHQDRRRLSSHSITSFSAMGLPV